VNEASKSLLSSIEGPLLMSKELQLCKKGSRGKKGMKLLGTCLQREEREV